MVNFLLALQFLTRIPLPLNIHVPDQQWGRTVLFYPLVGAVIGGLLGLILVFIPHFSNNIQAAILLSGWVLITGGLHLDGLADCADGWAGGLNNRARTLEIMKDPHIGVLAVVILILTLGIKWIALTELLAQKNYLLLLIIIPFLGRSAILVLMANSPYINPNGLAKNLNKYFPKKEAVPLLLLCAIIGIYSVGFWVILSAITLIFSIRYLAQQRLGGVNGDVYGASVELVETILLLGVI
ncbi:MAG: adenosylcobinamide-GDP ribazoletransferase [Methylococcales bacterium]|nr:adenosylcobinamide-GDP ribazoletransferase [Methylococcales bacterium]MCK5925581.1 adenosylcobinamide-GDP ribazoletransferase [Methylococcales bacterium]